MNHDEGYGGRAAMTAAPGEGTAVRPAADNDEATRRTLEALMNRYDLRPSDVGKLLSDMDQRAKLYATEATIL